MRGKEAEEEEAGNNKLIYLTSTHTKKPPEPKHI